VCVGDAIYFTMLPYNNNSDYVWTLNSQNNWSTDQYTGVLFNQIGNYNMSVVETNFGCVGPSSDTAFINVLGTPNNIISGPNQVIINDTITFTNLFSLSNLYEWNCVNSNIVNINENTLKVTFPSVGNYEVNCTVSNICTSSSVIKNVAVNASLGQSEIQNKTNISLLNSFSDGIYQIELIHLTSLEYSISVFQLNGQKVYTLNSPVNSSINILQINLNHMPQGIYFLKIEDENTAKIFKIIKL
jgi:hypothetical protein